MERELSSMDPEEGVERFLDHHRPGVRPTSFRNAKHRLSMFLKWCEEADVTELNDLTGRNLGDFVRWRQKQVSAVTLQKQVSTVRQALRYWSDLEAVEEGLAEKLHTPNLPEGAESRDEHIDADRMQATLEYYETHHYASRDHALLGLLWRTGVRRSAARSIDVDDLESDEHAVRLEHRPDTGTVLKNGEKGERWVYLGPKWFQIIADYRDNPDRPTVVDEHGRRPLFTTPQGTRPSGGTIYRWVVRALHECNYMECPHGRDPDNCDARTGRSPKLADCPSSKSPHTIRRGAITNHLNEGTTPEVVSERMDVTTDVLYEHYDARSEREKMEVRREQLPR